MPLLRLLWVIVVALTPAFSFAATEVGEFDIPGVVPLDMQALKNMRELVKEHPEAAALAAIEKQRAQLLFDAQPRPLEVIHYEGLVNTDPRRIASVEKLTDMTHAAVLVRHWQATGDPQAADALKRYILAWSDTYRITGNDVNENKFHPLLVAYHALRGEFSAEQRARVDEWVEDLGQAHVQAVRESDHLTNRYSKHLRLAATCGMILDRPEWVEAALNGVRRFVSESLYEDGTSRDLEHRDALSYHVSSLKPPLELAMLTGDKGRGLYQWDSVDGGSLRKSVEFVVPYAMGEKQYEEWRNSKVGLDKRRAEAGLEKYQPGHIYEPRKALSLMERAAYFDPELMKVVHHLSDSKAERFPTWQTLVNASAR